MTVKVVIPLSGGKDSQVCLKLASQQFEAHEIRALFCDTQWEHGLTYAHIEKLRHLYGPIQIDTITAGSVPEQVLKHERFPQGGSRFCTEELKIWPTKRYLKALAEEQGSRLGRKRKSAAGPMQSPSTGGGFQVWYGMRAAEGEERRARYAGKIDLDLYPPHEVLAKYPQYLAQLGVMFRLPILDWSTDEVFDFLGGRPSANHQSEANPLYEWFDRCGCFPCQASGDATIERAYAFDDLGRSRRVIMMAIAGQIGKSPFSSKGGQARNPHQCALHCGD